MSKILSNFRPAAVRIDPRDTPTRSSSLGIVVQLLQQPSRLARAALRESGLSRERELRVAISEPRDVQSGSESRHGGADDDRHVVEPRKQDLARDLDSVDDNLDRDVAQWLRGDA